MTDKMIVRNNPLAKSLRQSGKLASLEDLVRTRKAENVVILADCSGSMADHMRNGKSRIAGLRETIQGIRSEREVKIAQFGHGHEPSWVSGDVPAPSGGTPLHLAIDFAKNNGVGRAVVVSDGMPDSKSLAMEAAGRFGGRIDVVFIGDPGEAGEVFLKELAASTGGEEFTGDLTAPKELAGKIMGLLNPQGADDDDEDDED